MFFGCRCSPTWMVALAVWLSAGIGYAQTPSATPSQEDMDLARKAYSDGEVAYRLNKFDEAAKKYEEAYRIIKFPTMLFDIAQAWRRQYDVDKDVDH